jgi:hypothetical protein
VSTRSQIEDAEVFSRIPAHVFKPWLERERDSAYKYLAEATDSIMLHRAQGKVLLIERMLSLLDRQS